MKSGIYKIKNLITGRVYVGSSIDFKKRWNQHRSYLKNNKHDNYYLQNSWNKHGETAFKFFIIEECGEELLFEREQFWFNYYKENGLVYNTREVVESNFGLHHSEKTKKRLSEIGKNMSEETRKKIGEASKNSSEETRRKISEANRGKKRSEETKKKISEASKGHGVSKETRQKLKEINKGHKVSEETRKKISEGHLGVKLGDEHKKKISEGNTGRVFNEETKKKISKTLKLFYEKRREEKMKEENVSRAVELHESMKELRKEIEELKYLKRYIKDNGIISSIITIRVNSSLFAFSDRVASGNCENPKFLIRLIDELLREVNFLLKSKELELESF